MRKPSAGKPDVSNLTVWGLLWSRAPLLLFALMLIGIDRTAGLAWPYLSKYLIDDVILQRSYSTLLTLVGVGVAATLLQGVSTYLLARIVNLNAYTLVANHRKLIHDHVIRLRLAYFDANRTGSLVSRVMSDIEGVRTILGGEFASFLGAVVTACIAFAVLLRVNPVMTLMVLAVFIPAGLLARQVLQKYRPIALDINIVRAEVTGRLTESFGGVRVVKAYRAEAREHEVFQKGIDRLLEKVVMTIKASAFLNLMLVVAIGIAGGIVTYLGGVGVMAGRMTLGDLFRYVMFLGVLVAPFIQVVSIGIQFNEAYAGITRVRELLAEPREDQDAERSERLAVTRGEVCFESVSFAYDDSRPVLNQLNFRAAPGTITALVGTSGAGKSTITGLIAGFYKADQGTIRVDGIDLSRVDLDSYRAQLGIVAQDTFLFSGTIRENVAFGRPDASDEEIMRACRLAYVDEVAERLEAGYETVVGERGVKLSMGQRQRVAIARAFLADPRILILDEATSSLDSISEAVIQEALAHLLRDRTTFVIAHRLSTIRMADQILVIDGGRLVESGTHAELLRARGRYWQLYTTQHELQSNLFLVPSDGESETAAGQKESQASVL